MAVLSFLIEMDSSSLMLIRVFLAHENNAVAITADKQLKPVNRISIVLAMMDRMMADTKSMLLHLKGWVAKKCPMHI